MLVALLVFAVVGVGRSSEKLGGILSPGNSRLASLRVDDAAARVVETRLFSIRFSIDRMYNTSDRCDTIVSRITFIGSVA